MRPAASGPTVSGLGSLTAQGTLVAAPLLAFNVFPLPGIATLAMVLPLTVLAVVYVTTPGNRFPGLELALLAVLALSVIWGDDPAYSTERLRTFLPLMMATAIAGTLVSAATVLRCLKVAFAVVIVSSLVNIGLNPGGTVRAGSADLVLTGQFSKNLYGGLLVVALILVIDTRRRANLLLVPGLVVLLAVNRSATAWVVAAVLLLATYASRSVITRLETSTARPVLAVMGVAGLGGLGLLATSNIDSALSALGKDPTLGLRTEIWAASREKIQEAPLLGHGAFTFLDSASNSPVTQFVWARFQNYQPPHPHNGLLDLMGQVGLLGVFVFSALMAYAVYQGARRAVQGDVPSRTAVLVLAFILTFGATEPTYLGDWLVVTFMCLAIVTGRRSPDVAAAPVTTPTAAQARPSILETS